MSTAEFAALTAAVQEANSLLRKIATAVSAPERLMFNQAEAADLLGVSEKTVAQRRAEGTMRESDLFPGRVLFSRAYLDRLMAEHDGDRQALRRAS